MSHTTGDKQLLLWAAHDPHREQVGCASFCMCQALTGDIRLAPWREQVGPHPGSALSRPAPEPPQGLCAPDKSNAPNARPCQTPDRAGRAAGTRAPRAFASSHASPLLVRSDGAAGPQHVPAHPSTSCCLSGPARSRMCCLRNGVGGGQKVPVLPPSGHPEGQRSTVKSHLKVSATSGSQGLMGKQAWSAQVWEPPP